MWTRCSIDQDTHGRVVGCSVEVHGEDGPTTIWTTSTTLTEDPFDALELALQWRATWLGEQLQLF